jgi:predicted amidophosphoribosyltransferase
VTGDTTSAPTTVGSAPSPPGCPPGSLCWRRPRRPTRGNSAQRLRQVHDAFRLPAELSAAVADSRGPILLVDDSVDSGWTMTVAARLLRQAGADAVLPFALALTG